MHEFDYDHLARTLDDGLAALFTAGRPITPRRPSVAEERAAQRPRRWRTVTVAGATLDAHFVDGVPGATTIRANQAVTTASLALWGAAALSDAAAVGGMVFVWNLAVFAVALVWTGATLVAGRRAAQPRGRHDDGGVVVPRRVRAALGVVVARGAHRRAVRRGDRRSR